MNKVEREDLITLQPLAADKSGGDGCTFREPTWFCRRIGPYETTASLWIDGKRIHFNVIKHPSGMSIYHPPVFDKTIYITADDAGWRLVRVFTESLIAYVEALEIKRGAEVTITVEREALGPLTRRWEEEG